LRALNAQRGQHQDAPTVDNINGQESTTLGEAQIIGLHTENPLVMYNDQLLSLQWASTIGTDMFFAKPDADADSEEKPLRSLPNVNLLAMSSAKLVARVGRLRPRDELFDSVGDANGAAAQNAAAAQSEVNAEAQNSAEVSAPAPMSFLAKLNAAKAKRGDTTRLVVSKSGDDSRLVSEAAVTSGATQEATQDRGDVEMSGT
jgi:hypothetical protein